MTRRSSTTSLGVLGTPFHHGAREPRQPSNTASNGRTTMPYTAFAARSPKQLQVGPVARVGVVTACRHAITAVINRIAPNSAGVVRRTRRQRAPVLYFLPGTALQREGTAGRRTPAARHPHTGQSQANWGTTGRIPLRAASGRSPDGRGITRLPWQNMPAPTADERAPSTEERESQRAWRQTRTKESPVDKPFARIRSAAARR